MECRKWTEFIMWNHIFFVFEWIRVYKTGDSFLLAWGCAMLILSPLYHRSHECYYQPYEKITACSGMVYIFVSSWYYMTYLNFYIMIICHITNIFVWKYSNAYDKKHYECWHPWLHITIVSTIHCYQNLLE